MKPFNADIRIEAPATAVWQVLSDIGTWPAWTPTVSRVEVDGRPGIGSKVFLVQPRLKPATWTITDWQPDKAFAWTSGGIGYRIVATHALSAEGEATRVVLGIGFEGFWSALLVRFWGALSLRYLHQELDSLKRRCEQGRPGVGAQRPDRCAAWAANASNGEYRA